MRANKALIQGAGASAPRFIDYTIYGNPEMTKLQAMQRLQQDRVMRSYIEKLPQGVEMDKVPGSMRAPISQYLNDSRIRYGTLARQLSKAPAGSRQYMQMREEMLGIQSSYKNLSNELDNFKNLKQEFITDFDQGIISKGSDTSKLKELFSKDDYQIAMNEGKLNFVMEDGSMMAASSLPSYFNQNSEAVDGLLKLNEQAYKNAKPIDEASDYLYRRQVRQLVAKNGRDGMISLATDQFLDAPLIDIDNPNDPNAYLLNEENHDQLRDFLVNNWMSGISEAANDAYRMKSRSGNIAGGIDINQALQIWQSGDLGQISNLLPMNSKVKIDGYDDGTYDLKIGGRTMPYTIDPKNPQHLQLFMKALGLQMPNVNLGIDINQI